MVTIKVTQKLEGLDASDFDTNVKLKTNGRIIVLAIVSILNSISSDWNIIEEDVSLISAQSTNRRLDTYSRRSLSSSLNIIYQITAGVSGLTASQAASKMQSALHTSASNGNFGTSIQNAYHIINSQGGWMGTQYSGGTLTVSIPLITLESSSTPNPSLAPTTVKLSKDHTVVIIVSVTSTIGFILILSLLYYVYRKRVDYLSTGVDLHSLDGKNNSGCDSSNPVTHFSYDIKGDKDDDSVWFDISLDYAYKETAV